MNEKTEAEMAIFTLQPLLLRCSGFQTIHFILCQVTLKPGKDMSRGNRGTCPPEVMIFLC